MKTFRLRHAVWAAILTSSCLCLPPARGDQSCRAVQQEKQVALSSPSFVFRLDTAAGLRAASWENRLTGRKLSLGGGPELAFDIGLPGAPLVTPNLEVSKVEIKSEGNSGEVAFSLAAKEPALSVVVTYRWNTKEPVLHKFVEITNASGYELNRLLNVRLGTYATVAKTAGGEQGFPLYLDDERFVSLAHPAGLATAQNGQVILGHYPGARVAPGGKFSCMEAVYGVAEAGQARKRFADHVHSRIRRVVRGHDKPYAIFEPFGARPGGSFDETEEFVLDMISKVAQGQRDSGCHFDVFSIDFWVDFNGDIKKCDPKRFPTSLSKITAELKKLGTAPGLWIDSSMTHWSIGGNPAVRPTFTHDPAKSTPGVPIMCRATEPIKSMYVEGFRHHIRENGARLLKFDNFHCICNNPNHEHLPGMYSTQPIQDAVIEFLHAMDAECPDVFLMLYWGYRSPWWLLHADTLFDSGIGIEAASPSDQPAPHARDSITQKLDQAQWKANENVPPLGKDSLGVWLSDWPWNSQVGKESWQGGFVMDLCRGSLLAQPWSDTPWLSPPEREQMAEFIALLKAQPGCFGDSRFVLGDPRKDEPYGYCCTDGRRAFFAFHNCCWNDSLLQLELNSAWGLPDGQSWDLYRWYPDPARLTGPDAGFGKTASLALRPFEIVLLEAVPHGQAPTLDRRFDSKPIPTAFAEPSRSLDLAVEEVRKEENRDAEAIWTVLDPARFTSTGGATLRRLPDNSILAGGENPSPDTYTIVAQTDLSGITGFRLEVLPDPSLPGGGPGRAVNGNFALDELRVTASLQAGQATGEAAEKGTVPICRNGPEGASHKWGLSPFPPVKLGNPVADFSQETYGGWPVAAALDGDAKTGWSIDPLEGKSHTAVFETEKPVGFRGGTTLQFVLQQGSPAGHSLGRLRLSATAAKPPLPSPKPSGPRSLVVKGQVPASTAGGTLVVAAEMKRGSQPMRLAGPGKFLTAQGTVAGQTASCKPVLGTATYPACWQAWRIAVGPSSRPQPFELTIAANLGPDVGLAVRSHFIPGTKGRAS